MSIPDLTSEMQTVADLVNLAECLVLDGMTKITTDKEEGYPVQRQHNATQSRAVAITNLVVALTPLARASGCRTTSARSAIRTGPAGIRYPDVVVDCGQRDNDAIEASCPTVVIEVSSGTRNVEFLAKITEYQKISSIQTILPVDPDQTLVVDHVRRECGSWAVATFHDFADTIAIGSLGMRLSLSEIYGDLGSGPVNLF